MYFWDSSYIFYTIFSSAKLCVKARSRGYRPYLIGATGPILSPEFGTKWL